MNKCDQNNCIVNLSNSFLKRFGVVPFHESNSMIDELIKDKKKIVVLLFDGCGKSIINAHLSERSAFKSHILSQMSATFPPTTVASTNALLSGRFPSENGWMAWSQYFSSIDRNVNVFPNVDSQTQEKISDKNTMQECGSYKTICELINEKNHREMAFDIKEYPIDKDGPKSLRQLFRIVKDKARSSDETFVYAYWTKPDAIIHEHGVMSYRTRHYVRKLSRVVDRFAKKNPQLTIIVIADHGLIDVEYLDMHEHPDLMSLEIRPFSFEKRAANFFVEKKNHEMFKTLFNRYYGKYFELYTKKEVVEQELFGPNPMSSLSQSFLGDFLAVSIGNKSLTDYADDHLLLGHHGGSTLDEFLIYINYFSSSK